MRKLLRASLSVLLSFATLAGVRALNHLPYSSTRDAITDALSFPGGLIAWLFYSGGVHGGHAERWAALAIAGNLFFYALIWFFLLYFLQLWTRKPPIRAPR
ncbi:MAG: hypothetical protein WA672_10335 [Candidatus Angelobacter sp.]